VYISSKLFHILILVLLSFVANAETITGRVVGVHDGDTATVLDATNTQHKIRFGQIDAPELRQDFGQKSKDSLSDLIYGKQVTVEIETIDKYRREVGKVLVGGQDVNLEQVKRGMAWAYRQYLHEQAYIDAEASARAAKLGLWSRPDAVPPWEYRHGGKQAGQPSPVAAPVSAVPGSGSCGAKRYCKQMADCAEARHYLTACGVSSLDRDGDGTPCESLCK
jgi:endonuclease YncB( thermonuclease family)